MHNHRELIDKIEIVDKKVKEEQNKLKNEISNGQNEAITDNIKNIAAQLKAKLTELDDIKNRPL